MAESTGSHPFFTDEELRQFDETSNYALEASLWGAPVADEPQKDTTPTEHIRTLSLRHGVAGIFDVFGWRNGTTGELLDTIPAITGETVEDNGRSESMASAFGVPVVFVGRLSADDMRNELNKGVN